ncbi:uncharacterized protein LOC110919272 [Helianthus annuus]|uniref:uncharacterized protein LOC110919272 n=1 Tax=Helianthus annuus TaxID=4232 RepID=UPI000B8F50B6|nr:uncharacterized protein LOC110919272 [Helianthus annuus]
MRIYSIRLRFSDKIDKKAPNGIRFNCFFTVSVGDGNDTSFWGDKWLGNEPLRLRFPHLFRLERKKWVNVAERIQVQQGVRFMNWEWRSVPSSLEEVNELFALLADVHEYKWEEGNDKWKWDPGKDGIFTVKSAKILMSEGLMAGNLQIVDWRGWTPLKCKILAWRIGLDRIPTKMNLIKRGMALDSLDCPMCDAGQESTLHLFTGCIFSTEVWARLEAWCRLPPTMLFEVADLVRLTVDQSKSKKEGRIIQSIMYTAMWVLWNERNDRIFNNKPRREKEVFENIKFLSFFWIRNRSRHKSVDWNKWCNYPLDLM